MAAKQSMNPPAIAKKTAGKKSVTTRSVETTKAPAVKVTKASAVKAAKTSVAKVAKTPAPKVAKTPAAKVAKTPAAKVAKAPAAKVAKAPAAKTPAKVGRPAKTPMKVFSGNSSELNGSQGQDLMQQAIQTQAWMSNEITQLRQQLTKAQQSSPVSGQNAEIEQLQLENAALTSRLEQIASLSQVQSVTVKKVKKTKAPAVSVPKKSVKLTPVVKAAVKAASPAPASRKARSGVSILQEAAAADVNRTYKSCWPIVFKIEEWNQKHPGQLAKVSQTMLNKSGVNFSRAKGFMDNYGELVESYHQQIGLSKANSGKFNEVYEFIRAALGKGKKV
jgi:hypothetical protein